MSERKRVDIKAILADPDIREEIMEGATDFICKVEGIRPHSLSAAAQAVLDATDYPEDWATRIRVAAALRAAADQCKIEWNYHPDYPETESVIVVSDILAIAAELEGADG